MPVNNITPAQVDVLVLGAGFSGLYALYNLRKAGFSVKCYEKGSGLGGVWHWNSYPGARVDSDGYLYQFSDRNIWEHWEWKERFPGQAELKDYFSFVAEKWDLLKDIVFNREVIRAQFNEADNLWEVECQDGTAVRCRWMIMGVGFAAKSYKPDFKNFDSFKGEVYHTSEWPSHEINFEGKRVAVIGTGASGVQTIQELGPQVKHLTVYQRTPNFAVPMMQGPYKEALQKLADSPEAQAEIFETRKRTFGGVQFTFIEKNTDDDDDEAQRAFFKNIFYAGGLKFWVAGYQDLFFNQDANDKAYAFWAEQTRARIKDPKKRDLLAPLSPPHPWGTKRPSLEQNYYEVCDRENVDIIDVSADPIEEFTQHGIKTSLGTVNFDIIILATGFDSVTGSMTRIDLKGTDGVYLEKRWADGIKTYLGLSIAHYPNLFMMYGPLAPTAFSNGPTCTEVQGEWITEALKDLRSNGVVRFEATESSQTEWVQKLNAIWDMSLFPKAKSWYQGANIPGKKVQALNWPGGMPMYIAELEQCRQNDYQGFIKTSGK